MSGGHLSEEDLVLHYYGEPEAPPPDRCGRPSVRPPPAKRDGLGGTRLEVRAFA